MAGHAQLKFVMTECSKTQIRLTGLILFLIKHMYIPYNTWQSRNSMEAYKLILFFSRKMQLRLYIAENVDNCRLNN